VDRISWRKVLEGGDEGVGGDGALRASVGGESKEERRRGRPLGASYGSDSPVLDRLLLADAPEDRPPGYRGDLRHLHRYANEGVRGRGPAMRFASLKAKYRKEYPELAAEARG
jgi:hypothetical protein